MIGIAKTDTEKQAERLLERIIHYRIFTDEQGKLNKNIQQIQGGLLLVPQFTLLADTQKGNRPSFSPAAAPEQAEYLFNYFLNEAKKNYPYDIASGLFGANMQVILVNDGPLTFWLDT